MPPDARIDELYQLPLAEFTAARNALAKSLGGADAKHVRQLPKPTVVPWAVNQVYWRSRKVYDRLLESGHDLREAQIAALRGKPSDVRSAAETHRARVADAVGEALRLAGAAGAHPGAEPLSRMFEALSLAPKHPGEPGRLTEMLQPAGFEALLGVAPPGRSAAGPSPAPAREPDRPASKPSAPTRDGGPRKEAPQEPARTEQARTRAEQARSRAEQARSRKEEARRRKEEAQRAREAAAYERARAAERRRAEEAVARAEKAEAAARAEVERAHERLTAASRTLAAARRTLRDLPR